MPEEIEEKNNMQVEMGEVKVTMDNKIPEELEEKPLSMGSWLNLNLSDEDAQELTNNILEKIDQIDDDRKSYENKVTEYRNQYDQMVEDTSLPFAGCYNLCVPATVKTVDACISQTEEAFEDVDPKWSIMVPNNKDFIPSRDMQEKLLDHFSDTDMEDTDAWTMVYHDAFLLGTGWLAMVFRREFARTRSYKKYETFEDFQLDFPKDYDKKYAKYSEMLIKGNSVNLIIEKNEPIYDSPKPEHVQWEDVFVPIDTNGLEGMLKARIIARRQWKRWEEIKIMEKEGDFRPGVSNTLKYKLDGLGKPTTEIDPKYMKESYETYEVIYFYDIDGDGIEERCMFNIERSRKLCLRDIRYPYDHDRPYLIPYYTQKTRPGIYQPGLGEKLQQLNIAMNATINQVLNASVIANSLSLKVRQGSDAVRALYEHQWYPGSILELMNLDDVQQFNLSTPNLSGLISLFGILEKFSQDVSGIVNYLVGQESADDPEAPASKTMALMKKAELKLRRYIKTLKRSNNEAGYQALRLIHQFVPKKRIALILGIDVAEVSKLQIYPFKAITQSSGFAIEKMFEQRDDMQMSQMLLADPLVQSDPKRRVTTYRIIARDKGSNWDKKIEYILPTVEELQAEEDAAKKAAADKKQQMIIQAVHGAKDQGASDEEATQVGQQASRTYDNMLEQQKSGSVHPAVAGGKSNG